MIKIITFLGVTALAAGASYAGSACCPSGSASKTMAQKSEMKAGPIKAELSTPTGKALATYEGVSESLVSDNLEATQVHAKMLADMAEGHGFSDLAEHARTVAGAEDLEGARKAFVGLSDAAISLAEGHGGYFIMGCPMVKDGQWLQTSNDVRNPYMGQRMVKCGMVKRQTTETASKDTSDEQSQTM